MNLSDYEVNSAVRQLVKGAGVLALCLFSAACSVSAPDRAQVSGDSQSQSAAPLGSLYSQFQVDVMEEAAFSAYSAAAYAMADNDPTRAAGFYLKALDRSQDNLNIAERAINGLVFSGHVDAAARLAPALLADGRSDGDDLVRILAQIGAVKAEDWAALEAVTAYPSTGGFSAILDPLLLGFSHAARGDKAAAQAALAPIFDNPRLAIFADEFFAYMLDLLGETDAALTSYKALMQRNPLPSYHVHVAYADLIMRTKGRRAAQAELGNLFRDNPREPMLRREGMRLMRNGAPAFTPYQPSSAISLFLYRLASELDSAGSDQSAVIYLRMAHYLSPQTADIPVLLGGVLLDMERPLEAAKVFEGVAPLDPFFGAAEMRRAEALRYAERYAEAEGVIRSALARSPEDFLLLTSLGDIHTATENHTLAAEAYSAALATRTQPVPGDWWVLFSRAIAYHQLKDWAAAEADLLLALKLNPDQPDMLNYLGYSWVDRGERFEEALAMIERAAEARPEDGMVLDSLGWVHYKMGNFSDAVSVLEQAARLVPTDATVTGHLGDAYWRSGRKAEARYQWRHALRSTERDGGDKDLLLEKLEFGLLDLDDLPLGVPASP